MIRVAIEVREDVEFSRVVVRAQSLCDAVEFARGDPPVREVRVVFPIDAEAFFEPKLADESVLAGSTHPGRRPASRATEDRSAG